MNKQLSKNGRGIEWTDYTWNPIGGCLHGCAWTMPDGSTANCYAEDVADRVAGAAYPHGFEHHYWRPQLLNAPLKVIRPSRVFVGSMADVFGHWVPDEQIESVLDICRRAPWHTFQFLTKNAPRLKKFSFPSNCWIGASVPPTWFMDKLLNLSQQKRMLVTTLSALSEVKASVRWMSIEPLSWNISLDMHDFGMVGNTPILDWAVIGAASSGARIYQPEPHWVDELRSEFDEQGVKVFYKGNLRGNEGADPWREEFPAPITVRS